MIVHLNGWPGVGKKTIGSVLATRLGARFVHNHLLHDVAISCSGLGDPQRWVLYEEVRAAAYRALRVRPSIETFVMTNALCAGASREVAAWTHVVELAIARRVPLVPIVLEAEITENVRRLQSADRLGRKMTDADELQRSVATDVLQRPDVPELLTLDVTALSPDDAAIRIENHLRTVAESLRPAGAGHLHLR